MRVICVLTQADMVDDEVKQDTANVESSVTMHQMRQCVVQKAGLPLNQVCCAICFHAMCIRTESIGTGVPLLLQKMRLMLRCDLIRFRERDRSSWHTSFIRQRSSASGGVL